MPSFIPIEIKTTYEQICDLKHIAGITRKAIAIQNQSSTIIWIRVGENDDSYKQEFAFLPNTVAFFDYTGDLLKNKVYIKGEDAFIGRRVIVSLW